MRHSHPEYHEKEVKCNIYSKSTAKLSYIQELAVIVRQPSYAEMHSNIKLILLEKKVKMAKIKVQPDCGNSPRKLFLKDLNVAFAKGHLNFITDNIPDNILWNIVGQKQISERENYLIELKKASNWKVQELIIETIITHGPDASVSGTIIKSDKKQFAFCDIYRFKGAGGFIINSITSFVIRQ